MNAMNPPVIKPLQSALSLKLPGTDSPAGIIQQRLTDIILVQSLSTKKKLDSQLLGINAIAFNPHRPEFVSAYNNLVEPTVKVWSSEQGTNHVLCKNGNEISTKVVAFSSDGHVLLCGSGKNIYFWDTQSWKLARFLSLDTIGDVNALAFSRNGKNIIIGGGAGKNNLIILTRKSGGSSMCVLSGHKKKSISAVGFSPGGTRAISVCENTFKIWDITNAKVLYEDNGKSWSNSKIEYDKNNGWFLTGCDDVLGYWFSYDLNSRKKIMIPLQGKILSRVKAYERSACGNYIFLADAYAGNITVFNLRTRKCIHTITSDSLSVSTMACSPDGKVMIAAMKGSYETNLWLYHLITDENQKALRGMCSITGEQLEFVHNVLSKAGAAATLGEKKSDHITFDALPNPLKILLQEFVVPEEPLLDHSFTVLNRSELEPDRDRSDEADDWTLIDSHK